MNKTNEAIIQEILALPHPRSKKKYLWGGDAPRVSQRAKHQCEYCDLDLLASTENYRLWSIDHIIPKKRGGDHSFDNQALACKICNCNWKGQWNPAAHFSPVQSPRDYIPMIRQYVNEQREKTGVELDQLRRIVGYSTVASS